MVEGIRRLELFPDLRVRYMIDGAKCGGMTLRTLPLQVFYRRIAPDEITIFDLRWASLDKMGPSEYDQPWDHFRHDQYEEPVAPQIGYATGSLLCRP